MVESMSTYTDTTYSTAMTEKSIGEGDVDQEIPAPYYFEMTLKFSNNSLPCLLVLGLFGNIMSTIIFFRKLMRSSTTALFFRIIAINESIFLFCDITPALLDNYAGIETMEKSDFLCRIWNFVVFTCRDYAAWTLALLSMERVVGVLKPHQVKLIFTRRRANYMIAGVGSVVFSKNVFMLPILRSAYMDDVRSFTCMFSDDLPPVWKYFRKYVWIWLDFATYCAVPFLTIATCNIIIVMKLVYTGKASKAGASVVDKHISSMTINLIAVSITYLILSMPLCVYYLKRSTSYQFAALYYVALFCQYLNHSVNFYIYLLSGSRFRNEMKMLCCRGSGLSREQCSTSVVSTRM